MRENLSLIKGHMDQNLANSLFPVYQNLQNIHKDKAFLQNRSVTTHLIGLKSYTVNVTRDQFNHWMLKPPCACWDFRGILELTNFQEGFREALPYWLNQAFSTTQERVERAVQVDQVTIWVFCFILGFICGVH